MGDRGGRRKAASVSIFRGFWPSNGRRGCARRPRVGLPSRGGDQRPGRRAALLDAVGPLSPADGTRWISVPRRTASPPSRLSSRMCEPYGRSRGDVGGSSRRSSVPKTRFATRQLSGNAEPGGAHPHVALEHRTDTAAGGARDFGWIGTLDAVERLEATLETMNTLERFRGHFYNWYDTKHAILSSRSTYRRSTVAISPAISSHSRTPVRR